VRSASLLLATAGAIAAAGASAPAALAAAASEPRLSTLTYHGLAHDVVGRGSHARPNGERDARFTATLRTGTRVTLAGLVLQRLLPGGAAGEGWDATPASSSSILAVYLDGERLNPTDRDPRAALAPGVHRLEVYANEDYGVFAPGERFRLTAGFPRFVTAAAVTRVPGAAPRIASFRYDGRGGDEVGRGVDQTPNGEQDAHFVVMLDLRGTWQILENVALRRLSPRGEPDVPVYWMQSPQTAGLLVDGRRHRWPTRMKEWIYVYVPLAPHRHPVRLDVYANDPAQRGRPSVLFAPGERYELMLEFTDSELIGRTTATIRIP
jgi:hypothetical protein